MKFIRHFSIVGLDLRRFSSSKLELAIPGPLKGSKRAYSTNGPVRMCPGALLFQHFYLENARNFHFRKCSKLQSDFLEGRFCRFSCFLNEISTNRMTNDYFIKESAVFVFLTFICKCFVNAYYNNSVKIYTVCVIARKLFKSFVNRNIHGRSKRDYYYL